jgi:hypothetical protein
VSGIYALIALPIVALFYLTIKARTPVYRLILAAVWFLALLTFWLSASAPAKADRLTDYAAAIAWRICYTVDVYPTAAGQAGVLVSIATMTTSHAAMGNAKSAPTHACSCARWPTCTGGGCPSEIAAPLV